MSDTRRPRSTATDQREGLKLLLERMDHRQQDGFREVHSAIQGLRDHLGRTDARVEGLAQDIQREVGHIDSRLGRMYEANQKDIRALQDALIEHEDKTVESAAKGAVAAAISPDETAAQWRRALWGRMGAVGTFGLLAILVLKEIPLLLRSIGGFFAWLANVK